MDGVKVLSTENGVSSLLPVLNPLNQMTPLKNPRPSHLLITHLYSTHPEAKLPFLYHLLLRPRRLHFQQTRKELAPFWKQSYYVDVIHNFFSVRPLLHLYRTPIQLQMLQICFLPIPLLKITVLATARLTAIMWIERNHWLCR